MVQFNDYVDTTSIKMKQLYTFNDHHYFNTLSIQKGGSVRIFKGSRQRGAGLGSIIGFLQKYAIPLFKDYLMPRAAMAISNTAEDVIRRGVPLKSALKSNSKNFLHSIINHNFEKQRGGATKSTKKNIKRVSLEQKFNHIHHSYVYIFNCNVFIYIPRKRKSKVNIAINHQGPNQKANLIFFRNGVQAGYLSPIHQKRS